MSNKLPETLLEAAVSPAAPAVEQRTQQASLLPRAILFLRDRKESGEATGKHLIYSGSGCVTAADSDLGASLNIFSIVAKSSLVRMGFEM